jgi:hypothetical protein
MEGSRPPSSAAVLRTAAQPQLGVDDVEIPHSRLACLPCWCSAMHQARTHDGHDVPTIHGASRIMGAVAAEVSRLWRALRLED